MSLWRLIERSLAQRKLSSTLTTASVALGVMLVVAILSVQKEMESTYLRQGEGYSLVLGPAGGSKLELVLNSVFHVDQSAGLIPWSVQKELDGPVWNRKIRLAVPYALGDSFRGYRVVATTESVFSPEFPYPRSDTTEGKFLRGGPFRCEEDHLVDSLKRMRRGEVVDHEHDHEHDHEEELVFEAVLGFDVAESLGVDVGDRIEPTHGVEGGSDHAHEHLWTVTGILKETRSPVDRVVYINLDSFYNIPDHRFGRMPVTGEAGLSAVLVFPVGIYKPSILATYTNRPEVQVAEVGREVSKLLSIVGRVDIIFLLVAVLVIVIGVVSIMVAIYNTMNERRRELAIMRAIGARRRTIMLVILGESTALALAGGLAGILFAHLLLLFGADQVATISGLRLDPLRVLPVEFGVVGLVCVAGALAGLLPAWKAYRTDVAHNLVPLS